MDRDSGIAYRNEYCAVCNHVTNILPWVYRFECHDCAGENIDLIKSRCPDRLLLIQEIIETDCVTCGFSLPSSRPPARPCLPDSHINSKCLSQNKLEDETGISWEMEEYMSIATQCHSGHVQPVALCQNIISTVLYAMDKVLTASFVYIHPILVFNVFQKTAQFHI